MEIKWISLIFQKWINFKSPRKKSRKNSTPNARLKTIETTILRIRDWINCVEKKLAIEKKSRDTQMKKLEKKIYLELACINSSIHEIFESLRIESTEMETSHGSGKQVSGTARAYQD